MYGLNLSVALHDLDLVLSHRERHGLFTEIDRDLLAIHDNAGAGVLGADCEVAYSRNEVDYDAQQGVAATTPVKIRRVPRPLRVGLSGRW